MQFLGIRHFEASIQVGQFRVFRILPAISRVVVSFSVRNLAPFDVRFSRIQPPKVRAVVFVAEAGVLLLSVPRTLPALRCVAPIAGVVDTGSGVGGIVYMSAINFVNQPPTACRFFRASQSNPLYLGSFYSAGQLNVGGLCINVTLTEPESSAPFDCSNPVVVPSTITLLAPSLPATQQPPGSISLPTAQFNLCPTFSNFYHLLGRFFLSRCFA